MKKSFSHLSKIDILKYILLNELKFLYLLRSIQLARVRDYTWWQNSWFLDRENNDKNTTLPSEKQICFTIVWGCAEIFTHLISQPLCLVITCEIRILIDKNLDWPLSRVRNVQRLPHVAGSRSKFFDNVRSRFSWIVFSMERGSCIAWTWSYSTWDVNPLPM